MSNTAALNAEMNVVIETPNLPIKPATAETVGRSLKRAREERNMSLDEASRATKIRKEFLTAIEDDRFEMLPGDVFARGFVRSYADFLGLDGKAVAGRAAEGIPTGELPPIAGSGRPGATRNVAGLIGLGLVSAAAAAYWYLQAHGAL